jgi:hypothetical protein
VVLRSTRGLWLTKSPDEIVPWCEFDTHFSKEKTMVRLLGLLLLMSGMLASSVAVFCSGGRCGGGHSTAGC